jgi:hypothetical protein
MNHVVGIEMHSAHETGINFLTLGGVDPKVVKNKNDIAWI